MSLMERVYSVLLVSSSDKLNGVLCDMLPAAKFSPVNTVGNVSAAKRALAEREYDLVLINAPLPDEDGVRFSVDAGSAKNTVVLIMVRSERYDEVADIVTGAGVFLIPKPLSRSTVTLALGFLSSARERIRATEKKVLSFEEKMNEIRLVNRAKWLLISELKMTEPDAHRYVEKQAMDRCVPKRQVAEEIIKTYG
ncbi:MAG: ANTAR domain-containing protein [Clostridia bacterium]|nr:ANTAR domain-containing protein [Clostridia bacterium]